MTPLLRRCTGSKVRWQRGEAGGSHELFVNQPPRDLPVCWRPIRSGSAGDEADRVALVIDALGPGIDPAMADRRLQQFVEGHGLPAGRFLEDGDDQLPLRRPVVPQPAIELTRGCERRGLGDVKRIHAPSSQTLSVSSEPVSSNNKSLKV